MSLRFDGVTQAMKLLVIVLGSVSVSAFSLVVLLTAVIRRYVDPQKVREHPDIQSLFATQLLPKEMLTPAGQRLWVLRNVAIVVTLVSVVVIVIWQQILR